MGVPAAWPENPRRVEELCPSKKGRSRTSRPVGRWSCECCVCTCVLTHAGMRGPDRGVVLPWLQILTSLVPSSSFKFYLLI